MVAASEPVAAAAPHLRAGYIPSLDGIRTVSIAIVFLGHIGLSDRIPGGFGVTVFFFLSGYLITTLFCREWDRYGQISFRAFFARRLLRLSPPLVVCLLAGYGLVLAGVFEARFDPLAVASQIFYFHNYYLAFHPDPTSIVPGFTLLWSLAVEEHFYLIFPGIFYLYASGRLKLWHIGVLLAVILAWRYQRFVWAGYQEWPIYLSTDTRFDSILYGCVLAMLVWRGQAARLFAPSGRAMLVWCGLGLAVILFTLLYRDPIFRSTWRYSLQGIALLPLFYYAVHQAQMMVFRPLNWWVSRQLGIYSYNIYLSHFVIISAFEIHGIFAEQFALRVVVVLALTIAYSAAVFHLIEAPFRAWRARLTGHGS